MLKSVLIKFLHFLMKMYGTMYPGLGASQAKKDLRRLSFLLDLKTNPFPRN